MPDPAPAVAQLRSLAPTLSVGVLTADWMSLGAEVAILENAGVSLLHFDVMDGRFCPALTMGPALVKAVRTPLLKDVHLMIEEPLDKIAAFVDAGADVLTFHVEATTHPHRVLQALRGAVNANDPARGVARGIALNPGTPLEAAEPLLDEVDIVFLLAVNPGWGGQKFIPATRRRMDRLLEMIRRSGRDILIGLDGGITRDNLSDAVHSRADIIVTGSAVFDGKAAAANARSMLATIAQVRKL